MSASWGTSMQAAAVATLAHPAWWAMALAAFLVRGGLLIVMLPLLTLPTSASLTTMLAPPLEALYLGRPSVEGVVVGTLGIAVALAALAAAGVAGSWFDLALVREATADEELDLGWVPRRASAMAAFGVRLAAHLPTVLALGYAVVRLGVATRDELLSPGDPSLALAARVLVRAPEAVPVVAVAWLLGETVGALAARRRAAGQPVRGALLGSIRQVLDRRGLRTLLLTTVVLLALAVPFVPVVGWAWEHARTSLAQGVDAIQVGAAVVLLVSTWVLGLALLAAALAWRATAWTVLVPPALPSGAEPGATPEPEGVPG